jgi:hypothetical protein
LERLAGAPQDPPADGGPVGGQDGRYRRAGGQVVGRDAGPPGDLGRDRVFQPAHDDRPVVDEQVVALVGHLGQQLPLLEVGAEPAGGVAQDRQQRLEGRLVRWTGDQAVERGLDLGVDVVEEHRLLGREVAEERSPPDVGPLGDGVDGGLGEPLFREQLQGGVDDRRSSAIHVPLA